MMVAHHAGAVRQARVETEEGENEELVDLPLTAPAGRVTAILGPNGAGKTTTFRVLLGLARPTAGRALIDGRAYAELDRPRQTVGAVLGSPGFHPARTGRDHLRVGGYSTGMRQRLAVASALLGDPRVMVLDEPSSGLDPEGVAWMRRLLRELAVEGRCVLLASHLLAEVVQTADRVLIIARGRALREADVASLDGAVELAVRVDDPESLARALSAQQGVEG